MTPEAPRISLLQQRTIEARVVGPLIKAFQEELGIERANAIARRAVTGIALQFGQEVARQRGSADLDTLAEAIDLFAGQGDLEVQVMEKTPTRYAFNVTRCRFAEMYRALGLADLGSLLSCGRDYNLGRGINPRIQLARRQTIMEGAPYCDFQFVLLEEASSSGSADPAP